MMRAVLAALLVMLAACGQKGQLYLPDQAREVVTRPAQTPAPAPEAPSPQDEEPDDEDQKEPDTTAPR